MSPYFPKDTPETWPVGEYLPPGNLHAVSVSLPTWESVVQWASRDQALIDRLKTGYPRFYIHKSIQKLEQLILSRLGDNGVAAADFRCMAYLSPASVARCINFLQLTIPRDSLRLYSFRLPSPLPEGLAQADARWAQFEAIVYPKDRQLDAMAFWRQSGDGITSRQAEYAMSLWEYLVAVDESGKRLGAPTSKEPVAVPKLESGEKERRFLREFIAELTTVEDSPKVEAEDVFLYSKGMSAIYAVSRALRSMNLGGTDTAIVYGFPYAETVKVIEMSRWTNFTLYGHSTQEDLDELEKRLANGEKLGALFCELTGNPQLKSPNMVRLRALADKYGFPIACDDTVGSVNVNVLPFVDIIMTSLTKIFSGACDVMGGSVVVNPKSSFHDAIHAALTKEWEDTYFPPDLVVMAHNCRDVVSRVQKCSATAERLAEQLQAHPSVERVSYPSLVQSRPYYEQCKRKDGGYGYLLSIYFKDPDDAVKFYDNLDVPKGPSLGTNFTLAVAYAQIAHPRELDWAAGYDVPPHLVRISVGLEDPEELAKVVERALKSTSSS